MEIQATLALIVIVIIWEERSLARYFALDPWVHGFEGAMIACNDQNAQLATFQSLTDFNDMIATCSASGASLCFFGMIGDASGDTSDENYHFTDGTTDHQNWDVSFDSLGLWLNNAPTNVHPYRFGCVVPEWWGNAIGMCSDTGHASRNAVCECKSRKGVCLHQDDSVSAIESSTPVCRNMNQRACEIAFGAQRDCYWKEVCI